MPRTSSMPMAYKRSSPITDTVIERSAGRGALRASCERRERAPAQNVPEPFAQLRTALVEGLRTQPAYPGAMNPRVRRLIVSGVLGGLVLIVVVTAAWNWLR